MPSWLIDVAFLEAAGIILVVTGCFVAGVISGFMEIAEAEKANRRRASKERYAQVFTEAKRTVERCDQMLRCEQELAKAESWPRSDTEPTTFYADNTHYTIFPFPRVDFRIVTYPDGSQVIEYPPYVDHGEEVGDATLQQGAE